MPSGPLGAIEALGVSEGNVIGWENGFGLVGLRGMSGREEVFVVFASGPLSIRGPAARSDLNFEVFFDTGGVVLDRY